MILTKEQEEFLHEMYVENFEFEKWVQLMEQDFGTSCYNPESNVEH